MLMLNLNAVIFYKWQFNDSLFNIAKKLVS